MVEKRKAPNRKLTNQLNVRVPEELFRRVNSVAGAKGQSVTDFVTEVLDQRTKDHKEDVARMAEREQQPKSWK